MLDFQRADSYNVTKVNCVSGKEIKYGSNCTLEEAQKMVRGYRLVSDDEGLFTHQLLYVRKGSLWMYVIRNY